MSYYHSAAESFLEKNATGWSLGFSPNLCDKIAPTNVSEASTSTMKCLEDLDVLGCGKDLLTAWKLFWQLSSSSAI